MPGLAWFFLSNYCYSNAVTNYRNLTFLINYCYGNNWPRTCYYIWNEVYEQIGGDDNRLKKEMLKTIVCFFFSIQTNPIRRSTSYTYLLFAIIVFRWRFSSSACRFMMFRHSRVLSASSSAFRSFSASLKSSASAMVFSPSSHLP